MPNHVYHEVYVTGPADVLKEFYNAHIIPVTDYAGAVSDVIDFNTIIPMPAALRDTTSPCPEKDKAVQGFMTKLYGAGNWYDWSINNWGTKWNAYDGDSRGTPEGIDMSFQTAWSIPEPIFREIAELYPELTFNIKVCEEGGFFAGEVIISDGDLSFNLIYDDEDEWWEYAEEMMGWTRSEEGD